MDKLINNLQNNNTFINVFGIEIIFSSIKNIKKKNKYKQVHIKLNASVVLLHIF